jgi:hypothetical protein
MVKLKPGAEFEPATLLTKRFETFQPQESALRRCVHICSNIEIYNTKYGLIMWSIFGIEPQY